MGWDGMKILVLDMVEMGIVAKTERRGGRDRFLEPSGGLSPIGMID